MLADYTKDEDLPVEIIDKVIREGKKMGVYFYTILGERHFSALTYLKFMKSTKMLSFKFLLMAGF